MEDGNGSWREAGRPPEEKGCAEYDGSGGEAAGPSTDPRERGIWVPPEGPSIGPRGPAAGEPRRPGALPALAGASMQPREPAGLGRRPGGPAPSGLALSADRAPNPYPPYPSPLLRVSPLLEPCTGRAIGAPSAEDWRAGPAGKDAALRPADGLRGAGATWLKSAESSASIAGPSGSGRIGRAVAVPSRKRRAAWRGLNRKMAGRYSIRETETSSVAVITEV